MGGNTMRCRRLTLLLLAAPVSIAWSAQSPLKTSSLHTHPTGPSISTHVRPMQSAVSSSTGTAAAAANIARIRSGSAVARNLARGGAVSASASGAADGDDSGSESRPLSIGVVAVLCAAFLNLLGFTMAGPITPALGQHFGLEVGTKFGSLTSAYPLGMLFGLFIWPQFSDKRGRKPVMALSLLGSAIGLSLQSFAIRANWSLPVFLASRVLTGCFAGSSPVSKAYLADVGRRDLPRYLALRDAASTLAFILGPTLGGLFYEARRGAIAAASSVTGSIDATSSLSFVIGTSAVASLAASLLIALFVEKESTVSSSKPIEQTGAGNQVQPKTIYEEEIISCPLGNRLWAGVASVCAVSFLFNVGDSTFFAFFPALLKKSLGLDASSIGLAFTSFACISFAISTTLTGPCIRRYGPVATCIAGLSTIGTGLVALAGASSLTSVVPAVVFGAAALYYCGVPLYGPTVPTMLLRCVPPNKRGAVMGLDGAVNTLARVISPLFMGSLYHKQGPSATFGLAGIAALSAAVIALIRRFLVLRVGEGQVYVPKQSS